MRSPPTHQHYRAQRYHVDDLAPCKIHDDRLLTKLQEQYPERRYGYTEDKEKEAATCEQSRGDGA